MHSKNDKTLLIDDADDCILGYINRCGETPIVIYDYELLIEHYQRSGMTEEEAAEWIDFNVIGAWVGSGTPGVLIRATRDDVDEMIDS